MTFSFFITYVKLKMSFLQLSEGLHFLHDSVKMLHRNLGPGSIILNHQGAWKIFGFDFCVANCAPANQVHKIGIHHRTVYVFSVTFIGTESEC